MEAHAHTARKTWTHYFWEFLMLFLAVFAGFLAENGDNLPSRLDRSPPLIPGYRSSLNEFNYRLVSVKNVNKAYRREARKLLLQATNLLEIFKKQYQMK